MYFAWLSPRLRAAVLMLSGLLLSLSAHALSDGGRYGYYAKNGRLYDPQDRELVVRGVSHFGFNTTILQPMYLWQMGWKAQIDQIKSLGFNAIRVPFVPATLYSTTSVDKLSYVDPNRNPDLIGKTPLEVLDLWMAYADAQGLYVMLDMHSVSAQRQYPTWFVSNSSDFNLTYNGKAYGESDWIRDLSFVARRYAKLAHFFAIDLYNEPEGVVRWTSGDPNATNPAYFWKRAAEAAGNAVLQANPSLLIFVQGINGEFDGMENSNIPMNWGEDFQPERYQPSTIPDNKLVLSPHTYGPDGYEKSSFSAPNFPANLAADWNTLFGQFYPTHPVVTGEFGGRYGDGPSGSRDKVWQDAFVSYLLDKGIHSSFYWCYTPNSSDTGGILDDNLKVRQDKMALLHRLWGSGSTGSTTPPPSPPPPPPPPAASLAFAPGSYSVAAAARSVTITVARSGGTSGAVSVHYATANGTAAAGSDYVAASGSLSWAAGDTAAKSFSLTIKPALLRSQKNFAVKLTTPGGNAKLGSPAAASVTLRAGLGF